MRGSALTVSMLSFTFVVGGFDVAVTHAATWQLEADGSGDAATIQDAVDVADPGDILLLAAGTYRGPGNRNIDFGGKDLELRSVDGPAVTILDAEGSPSDNARGFHLHSGESAATVIDGITIRNGFRAGSIWPDGYGGGMLIEEVDTNPTVTNCIFESNYAGIAGSAAHAGNFAQATFVDCVFRQNDTDGTGTFGADGGSPELRSCRFEHNLANGAAGVYFAPSSTPLVVDCVFTDNSAGNSAAILSSSTNATIRSCEFRRNESTGFGGALSLFGQTRIEGCLFDGNTSGYLGGAIYCAADEILIEHCTFVGNFAQGQGSALHLVNAYVELYESIVSFNTGTSTTTVSSDGSELHVSCSNIYGNEGGDWTGYIAGHEGYNQNLSADPHFCNLAAADFSLASDSPCVVSEGDYCDEGNIGAYGVGCIVVPVRDATWGSLKARFH